MVDEAAVYFRVGARATGVSASLSMALVGVGHLVGISVGMAMFVGIIIGWGIVVPLLTGGAAAAAESAQHVALAVFRTDIRFLGAGVIGVAALWTFSRILRPIIAGLRSAMAASSARAVHGHVLPLVERDLSIKIVGGVTAGALALIALLLWQFIAGGTLAAHAPVLIAVTLVFVLVAGVVDRIDHRLHGGAHRRLEQSGFRRGMLAVVAAAFMLIAVIGHGTDPGQSAPWSRMRCSPPASCLAIATISNDNLQDLKTGQLVGATPWRQQVALVFGVIFGSLVIPPVLEPARTAPTDSPAPPVPARELWPRSQAALISALAQGSARWPPEPAHDRGRLTAGRASRCRRRDAGPRRGDSRLPPLAIGLGIYLADRGHAARGDRSGGRLRL